LSTTTYVTAPISLSSGKDLKLDKPDKLDKTGKRR
jgi:hypothetical protein